MVTQRVLLVPYIREENKRSVVASASRHSRSNTVAPRTLPLVLWSILLPIYQTVFWFRSSLQLLPPCTLMAQPLAQSAVMRAPFKSAHPMERTLVSPSASVDSPRPSPIRPRGMERLFATRSKGPRRYVHRKASPRMLPLLTARSCRFAYRHINLIFYYCLGVSVRCTTALAARTITLVSLQFRSVATSRVPLWSATCDTLL